MRSRSIRFKLTALYTALLAATICAVGLTVYFTARAAALRAADHSLAARLRDIGPFINGRLHGKHAMDLPHEFAAHLAGLRPGGEMLQVADARRQWLYRSDSMATLHVTLPPALSRSPEFTTIFERGLRVRVLSARILADNRAFFVQLGATLDPYYETLGYFRRTALWMLPLVLALAWVSGYALCWRALRPIDEVTEAAKAISARSLGLRLPVPPAHDELQRLTQMLNGMLTRLESSFQKVSQFTADAAHELRTPVALILTTSELALRDPGADTRAALQEVRADAMRSRELIENLMFLARADEGLESPRLGRVDLNHVFHEASIRGAALASTKGVQFRAEAPADSVDVRGNGDSLERLALILIDNAVKFTRAPGNVTASLIRQDYDAILEVRDTGPGIPAAEQSRIFERFYRADPARSRQTGGVGLGLAIARTIAEYHSARLEVESLGTGSTFRFRIPTWTG